METITDYELDTLFQQSAQQHKAVEQINRQVMRAVRREMRLKTLRKWAKLLGLCFGLPVAVVVYIYALFLFMPEMPEQLRVVCMAVPVATILSLAAQRLHYFSPEV
ncbi:MAG: hypothetical protein II970_05165 [Paludibacteraceae bacterium]|nr:hypothetical protein [Paludibacteraceae bacterium]